MEHEVFVPLPVADVRQALADPRRIARAVPGLQHDAGAEPLTGRLKLRIGSTTVTYRGSLRVTDAAGRSGADGFTAGESHVVTGEAAEARGPGTVKFTLALGLAPAGGGTRLTFTGTGSADGRTAELPPATVESALRRTLTRFAENLTTSPGTVSDSGTDQDSGTATESGTGQDSGTATDPGTVPDAGTRSVNGRGPTEATPLADRPGEADLEAADDTDDETPIPPGSSLFDTEVPPPSLDPYAEEDLAQDAADAAAAGPGDAGDGRGTAGPAGETMPPDGVDGVDGTEAADGAEPPAEAAHARRTMIGRSAEEVDHAPPRGRYAPVPPPDAFSGSATLRWAAPAAALVVASAIVVGRALRRRQ